MLKLPEKLEKLSWDELQDALVNPAKYDLTVVEVCTLVDLIGATAETIKEVSGANDAVKKVLEENAQLKQRIKTLEAALQCFIDGGN